MKFSFHSFSLSFILFCLSLPTFASEPEETLILQMIDGTKEYFFLADKPVIYFEGEILKFKTDSFSTDLDNISSFKFDNVDRELVTSLNSLKADNHIAVAFKDGKAIQIHGVSVADVHVYSVDGRSVNAEINNHQGGITINFSSLPVGIYIVKVNNQSYKINNK